MQEEGEIEIVETDSGDERWWNDNLQFSGLDSHSPHFLLLNAKETSKIETPIPRQQEVTTPFFQETEEPIVILFFSHRWETKEHPDPSGAQWNAIQLLLQSLWTLAKAAKEREDDRLKLIPNLRSQTFLIASYVLGKISHDKRLDEGDWVGSSEEFADHILGRIGIFYDYLCLPQLDRTNEEEELFCNMLKKLQSLCNDSVVISLRNKEDDYENRAWCIFEQEKTPFPLSFYIDDLSYSFQGFEFSNIEKEREEWEQEGIHLFCNRVKRWELPGRDTNVKNQHLYFEIKGDLWDYFGEIYQFFATMIDDTMEKPVFGRVSKKSFLLTSIVEKLLIEEVSRIKSPRHSISFRKIISVAMNQVRLYVTDDDDISIVGYMICLAATRTELAELWAIILLKAIDKKRLDIEVLEISHLLKIPLVFRELPFSYLWNKDSHT